ncbi:hypothetical protein LUZ61_007680 [Rhynchospora tenuis]|uniref:DUF641 domain-containing protein n=1 Tax=Rhynchospora tenuis TaxID=198213 RepID=A0AAD6EWV0_9POAL|nr:hypothetical protein LUZ61_007680 [Rhynchospora tenuis]
MDSAKKPFYHYKKEEVNKTKPPLASMDSTKKSPPSNHLTLTKTLSKLLHPRHNTSSFPEPLVSSSSSPSSSFRITTYTYTSEEMESLLGQLFASVSSIKAAYAQLQLAQSPYDPASIQSADLAVVTELRRVSDLKRAFVNHSLQLSSPLQSQINEQHSLLKTYEITTKQLEFDVDQKDFLLISLRSELSQLNLKIREFEMKLYPGKTMASLDGLHLSGLNPTHFLCTLRFAVNSIRNFVRLMVEHMIHACWDMDAAAKAVHPGTKLKSSAHRSFYFESYICNIMFSDFHKKDFNLEFLQDREKWDSTKFFHEFMSMKSLTTKEILHGSEDNFTIGFKLFLSAKYLSMVQPKMELSFFGDLDQRNMIKSCREYPNSEWFMGFAEMARRVWLLHCLFFSFGLERKVSIFQVRKGTRFSEVHMENAVADESSGAAKVPTYRDKVVGFTVVPGFQVGMTLIQARVYLSGMD